MKIELPLENWADLLPSVPRRQLVQLLFQLGDRQFVAKILQPFLNEFGQITLGHLRIVAPRENAPNGGGPIVEVRKEMPPFRIHWYEQPLSDLETDLPEGPMPTNVKDFKLIELSYFDESVANFLRQFQKVQQPGNSLLDNVNLWFPPSFSQQDRDDNLRIMPILAQLMPMIGNINSMSICRSYLMGFGRSGLGQNNDAASQLLKTMLKKTRILEMREDLEISEFAFASYLYRWLYTPRKDGKPRALRLRGSFPDTNNLVEQIKKDFSKHTHSICFSVYVEIFHDIFFGGQNVEWPAICLDNRQTNERLIVKTIDPPPMDYSTRKLVLISRYPVAKQEIEANEQEIMAWNFCKLNRQIRFALE